MPWGTVLGQEEGRALPVLPTGPGRPPPSRSWRSHGGWPGLALVSRKCEADAALPACKGPELLERASAALPGNAFQSVREEAARGLPVALNSLALEPKGEVRSGVEGDCAPWSPNFKCHRGCQCAPYSFPRHDSESGLTSYKRGTLLTPCPALAASNPGPTSHRFKAKSCPSGRGPTCPAPRFYGRRCPSHVHVTSPAPGKCRPVSASERPRPITGPVLYSFSEVAAALEPQPPVVAMLHPPSAAQAGAGPPGRRFLQPCRGLVGHVPLGADPVRSGLLFLPPAPHLAAVCPSVFHVCVPSVNLSVWFVHFSTHFRHLDSVRKFMFAPCPHCPPRLRCARARACWACAPPRGSRLGCHS